MQDRPPPQQVVMQMLTGRWLSQAVTSVATLKLADFLKDGPATADAVAERAGCSPDAVNRLLRALSSVGLFEEKGPRTYALTDASQLLRSDVEGSLRGMARWTGCELAATSWAQLDHAVRTATPAVEKVTGRPFFEHLQRTPETMAIFNDAMTSHSASGAKAVAEAYDVSWASCIVDVGGGHGVLLSALLEKAPRARGILFDMPDVVAGAAPVLKERGMSDRIRCVGGNFLETTPAGGDLYVMKHIIHDWDDARCAKILSNCRAHLKPSQKVAVVEMMVTNGPESVLAKLLDLEMLVMAPGGRERTEAEMGALFAKAGIRLERVVKTKSPACVFEGVVAT